MFIWKPTVTRDSVFFKDVSEPNQMEDMACMILDEMLES